MIVFRPVSKTSTNKSYICQQYVYIVFIKEMSEGSKQLPNWLRITEISTVLIVVLLPLLAIALHESCTRKNCLLASNRIQQKIISSQSNFTAQKDQKIQCRINCFTVSLAAISAHEIVLTIAHRSYGKLISCYKYSLIY